MMPLNSEIDLEEYRASRTSNLPPDELEHAAPAETVVGVASIVLELVSPAAVRQAWFTSG